MKWGRPASRICIGNMAENLLTPALTVFEHMALDEVLCTAERAELVLRFYHWTPGPAVTFGYSQFVGSVQSQVKEQNGPLCRRPTGGGIVFHGADLTFSLVFESTLRPSEIYAKLHGAIEQAFVQENGLHSTRQGAVSSSAYAPTQNGIATGCFANPVQDDLLIGGQKILGGAIRRLGSRVLYQGSLQCLGARTNPAFRRAVTVGAQKLLGVVFKTSPVEKELLEKAKALAVSQYQTTAWTEKFI